MELKPCPFCGGEARIMLEEEDRPDDSFHNVYCTICGAQFWVKSKTEAVAKWNRRADGWIAVEERLPEVGKCVLIRQTYHAFLGEHGEYEGVTVGYLHQPTDRRRKPYFYFAAVSDYGDMVRAQSICPGSEYVTHWMPLPEPPEQEGKDINVLSTKGATP